MFNGNINYLQKYFNINLLIVIFVSFLLGLKNIIIRLSFVPSINITKTKMDIPSIPIYMGISGHLIVVTILIVFFLLINILIFKSKYKYIFILFYIFSSIFLFLNNYSFNAVNNLLTFNLLRQLNEGVTFFSTYYFKFFSIKYFIICFWDIPIIHLLLNKLNINKLPKIKKYEKIICILLILILWVIFIKDAHLKYRRSCLPLIITSYYGFIPSLISDYEAYINSDIQPIEPDEQFKKCIFKDNNIPSIKFKNIFIIQLESIGSNIIDFKINDKEITPFLNSFKNKSIFLPRMISHHKYGSMDSEFGLLNGKQSSNIGSIYYSSTYKYENCLTRIFKNYNFNFYHGNNGGFFHRDIAYKKMSFNNFYDSKRLWKNSKVKYQKTINDFIPDHIFFNIVKKLIKENSCKFKFCFIETITSHTPFRLYPKNINLEKFTSVDNELIKDMFISFRYLDQSLKTFVNWIQSNFNNYFLIIFGDHVPVLAENNYYKACKINGIEYVPCFIYFKDIKPTKINKIYSHINIYYTLNNLMIKKD